jgi:hypothetical protein
VKFATSAAQLAGQTAILFGWRPEDFWNATPAELATILVALTSQTDDAVDADMLAKLMKEYPDG